MSSTQKMMIGGQALRHHGHDRHTDDVDYATYDESSSEFVVSRTDDGEVINLAALGEFGRAVWQGANPDAAGVADAQSLAELKGLALIEHMRQGNFAKVAADEYDLAFLGRQFGVTRLPALRKREGAAAIEAERELSAHTR